MRNEWARFYHYRTRHCLPPRKLRRGERCRAHARMINVKPSRGEKFFANEGKNAITSQLDIMPEGG
jgi:hypothetical protein